MRLFLTTAVLAAANVRAQDLSLTSFPVLTGTNIPTSAFTGSQFTYISLTSQRTVGQSSSSTASSRAISGNASVSTNPATRITRSSSSQSLLIINGQTYTMNGTTTNQTASRTTSSAQPSNTVPCNNYPEFCNRRYSNITEVCAHNSAFAVKRNAASNQVYGVLDQLNDGIRMIQGETHLVNGTIYNCHTSCDLLNAGRFQDMLDLIADWLSTHPYEVVTILVGNSNFASGVTVNDYVPAIQNSRIAQYLYEPAYVPQYLNQWPTLGQMILSGKRVVMFMDYNANQTQVPYVIDEFSNMWETPFSPVDESFPCDTQRPPNLDQDAARDKYLYIANHNLNVAIDISALLGNGGDTEILIPDTARINRTNGEYNQFGMLGAMNDNCTAQWGRPPNFLLVDYYNFGYPDPGSVFEVAARANGVTYNRKCCGNGESAATTYNPRQSSLVGLTAAILFAIVVLGS